MRLLSLALLSGCIETVGPGPDLGACADPPAGTWTYGQIGIGTCLAGPTDLTFFEQDGTTWLAVTNADPFLNFDSGSVVLVDWDSVDLTRPRNLMHQVDAHAWPTERYVGGVAYVADAFKRVLLVPGRLSEGASSTAARDHLFVIDVSDPTRPRPWGLGDEILLRDDPQLVSVDPDQSRAYVANLTDHSVSVLDTSAAPIEAIDLAPRARVTADVFFDADASGSTGEVDTEVFDASDVPDDTWTLTWIEGAYRAWSPSPEGLYRYDSGGGPYRLSGFGVQLDPADSGGVLTEVRDPLFLVLDGIPTLLFVDGGDVWAIVQASAATWEWSLLSGLVLGADEGWDAVLGGPGLLQSADGTFVYYDARSEDGAPASIGVATTGTDGGAFQRAADPILVPAAPWVSFESPYVRPDAFLHRNRMWLSLWDGDQWSIGATASDDGLTWDPVDEVLRLPSGDLASPTVLWANGRYLLWAALGDGTSWSAATAWSYDGLSWSDPEPVFPIDGPYDPSDPPRVAVQLDASGGYRVEGAAQGQALGGVATADGAFSLPALGFSIQVSNGYEISPRLLDGAAGGMLPGSLIDLAGTPTLYVSEIGRGGRRGVGAVQQVDGEWVALASDIAPRGATRSGPRDPVVFGTEGAWQMLYAAADATGVVRLVRATSTDGLTWSTADLRVPALDVWETGARIPHQVEARPDGSWRLWYTGQDTELSRIGVMTSPDGAAWTAVTGETDGWVFGPGDAGQFDDAAVRDPFVITEGDTLHLWYGAYDGATWRIGHAVSPAAGLDFTRVTDPRTDTPVPALDAVGRSFASAGVRSPLVTAHDDGSLTVWFAGTDGARYRVGKAIGTTGAWFPAQRFPTVGDDLTFDSRRGDPAGGVIELQQAIDGFTPSGLGVSSMTFDAERGFLYLTAKRTLQAANYLYVIDVRDDSSGGFLDTNTLDLEALLVINAGTSTGFRGALPVPGTDLLLATSQTPDALVAFDLSKVVDDDDGDVVTDAVLGALPMRRLSSAEPGRPFQDEDEGVSTSARMSGAGMALAPDGRTLLVTHFRDNSVIVFDLGLGTFGEEIARIPNVGENPHVIRITPDGKHAVVGNYLGDVDDETVSATMAVIDIDPTSPTWLEVVTWLANR